MPVVGVVFVEARHPLVDGRHHLALGVLPQLAAGPVAGPVLVDLEQFEQLRHARAGDVRLVDQRPLLVDDPPDPPVLDVAVRVAERVLHVADQRVVPVDDVEGAVGAEFEVDRPEVLVGRLRGRVDRLEERLDGRRLEPGAVLLDAIAEDAVEADHIVEQIIALRLIREVPAGDQLAARGRPPLLLEELVHPAVLVRIVDLAGEGGAEVVGPARGVGHEVLAPAVDVVAPRVGEAVGDLDLELLRPRLVAEDARRPSRGRGP